MQMAPTQQSPGRFEQPLPAQIGAAGVAVCVAVGEAVGDGVGPAKAGDVRQIANPNIIRLQSNLVTRFISVTSPVAILRVGVINSVNSSLPAPSRASCAWDGPPRGDPSEDSSKAILMPPRPRLVNRKSEQIQWLNDRQNPKPSESARAEAIMGTAVPRKRKTFSQFSTAGDWRDHPDRWIRHDRRRGPSSMLGSWEDEFARTPTRPSRRTDLVPISREVGARSAIPEMGSSDAASE